MWLVATISFYLILAVVFLVDKYLLIGKIPNPKVYTFYVGALGILVLFSLPFVDFEIPSISQIILALSAGAIFIFALFWLYKGLQLFEASRIVPAIGGFTPLFTLGLIYLSSGGQERLSLSGIIAFSLLVLGSILITSSERARGISLGSLKISILAAFLLSLSFVLAKYVYMTQPFWSGYVWIRIGGFLMALCFFIFAGEIRREIFKKREFLSRKTAVIFISNQVAGAGANVLQNLAFALVPLAYLAVINALQGVQYVFLLVFTAFLSLKFPRILKEEISKEILLQKIIAILLIGGGLTLLALK